MKKYFLEGNYFDKTQQRVWTLIRERGSSVSKLDREAIKSRRGVLFATKKDEERQKAERTSRPNKKPGHHSHKVLRNRQLRA